MNETELHDVFVTLTRNPAPSRYEVGSVRAASKRRKRQKWSALGAAVLIGAVIAGTTWLFNPGGSPSPAEPAPAGFINLKGEWVLTGLNTADGKPWRVEPRPGVRREPPTLRFGSAKVTVLFGCNSFDAEYKQSGQVGQDLLFDNFGGMRAVDCDQPPLYERLPDVRQVSQSGNGLSLFAADESLIATLERASTEPINIEREWVLTALTDPQGKGILSSDPGPLQREMQVEFKDGRVRATMNCSEVTATYEQSANRDISFGNIESDVNLNGAVCNPIPPLAERLQDVRHLSNDNGKLQLHDENWMIIAVLERANRSTSQRSSGTTYEETLTTLTSYDGKPGFGKVVVNETEKHIDVYWKGEIPADVLRLVGVAKDGTVVSVQSARFSSEDYRLAGQRVFAKMRELQGSFAGTTSGNSDMTGLVLMTPVLLSDSELAEVVEVAGMPVTQVQGEVVMNGGLGPLTDSKSE